VAALAAALLALGPGCATQLMSLDELPERPIAVLHRAPEEAREYAEWLSRGEEERARAPGILDRDALEGLLGGAPSEPPARLAGNLALVDPRTGGVRPIETAQLGALPFDWAPDGRQLLLSGMRQGRLQIFELDLEGLELRPLTHGGAHHLDAVYGPDGRIAFTATPSGRAEDARIFVSEPGGRDPRQLSPGPYDRSVAWSPDGATIVYVSGRSGGAEAVTSLPVDGSEAPRRLARGRDPVFTPDGEWIVYSALRSEGWRLWRMRVDGSGKTAIGVGRTDELEPAVSPDGRYVAYVSEADHRQSLRVRRFDGSGDRILLEDGDGSHPVW
jgi:Tol biopolymer transport system component